MKNKTYTPTYVKDFTCLCERCSDTCCAKWQIPVDEETVNIYRQKDIQGDHALFNGIYRDDDGDYLYQMPNNRCYFLEASGLCRIHLNYGAQFTSCICRQHPDFTEEYDEFTEICPSMSCPAACDLIFNTPLTEDVYPVPDEKPEDEWLQLLLTQRTELLKKLCKDSDCFDNLLSVYLKASEAQKMFDESDGLEYLPLSGARLFSSDTMDKMFSFMLYHTEILTEEWKQYLQKGAYYPLKYDELMHLNQENKNAINKATAYFVYRYYLKAINGGDAELNALFIIFSVLTGYYISQKNGIELTEAYRLYSKEIEHDTDNIADIKNKLFQLIA